MNNPNLTALITALRSFFSEQELLTDPATCLIYGYDNSRKQAMPDVVLLATQPEQIQQTVLLCNQYHIPLTVRGRATNTTGAVVPVQGGVVLSLEKMQNIICVDPDNRAVTVQPGVLNQTLQDVVGKQGFFWAPDPGSAPFCTVGGNLACNAAGPHAVKYGSARENTLALKVVTGAGELIETGSYTTKGVVGYDLTRLLIGSEGTLGIITEATLKLTPLPEDKKTIRAVYSDIDSATAAVVSIMSHPVFPSALEFMDKRAIALVRDQGVELPENAEALLLIEIDGITETLNIAAQKIMKAATNAGLIEIELAETAAEAKQLWQARKALSPALRTIASQKINEDVVVPVSQLPVLIDEVEKLSKAYGITIVNFGHAGNGNIHVNLLFEEAQRASAESCLDKIFDFVLACKGTLSGEHGIGMEKKIFINREIDSVSFELMKKIKKIFDPNQILNPGKWV